MDYLSEEEEKDPSSKRKRKNFQIKVGFPGSLSSGSELQYSQPQTCHARDQR